MEKSKPSYTAGKNVKCASTWENSLAVAKVKHRVTIWSSDLIPMYISKRNEYMSTQKLVYKYS